MTEEEIVARRLEAGEDQYLSDVQKEKEAEAKERATYGRYWVWNEYFNERNKEQWLDTA